MTTMDLNNESVWVTTNQGVEYTAIIPFSHPRLAQGSLTILVLCDWQNFSTEDREHARQRMTGLSHRLDGILDRMMEHIDFNKTHEFHTIATDPTLMLEAGNHTWWTFAIDNATDASTLFVEWEHDEVTRVWRTD